MSRTSLIDQKAKAGYLPTLSADYFYGIDATRFATKTDGINNLGSSIVATVTIPIWNWGTTQSRVRQAELRRNQSKRELSLAQRKLLAEIQGVKSPLTLLLCPTVLAKAMREAGDRVDRQILQGLVQQIRQGLISSKSSTPAN